MLIVILLAMILFVMVAGQQRGALVLIGLAKLAGAAAALAILAVILFVVLTNLDATMHHHVQLAGQ